MIKELSYAKGWGKRTAAQINKTKREVCKKHNCQYFRGLGGACGGNENITIGHKYCDYASTTGKLRGCLPEDCTHWQDEDVSGRSSFGSIAMY